MTRTHHQTLVVAMLVVALLAGAFAGVATAETETTTDAADLIVEQPSYVDEDVSEQTDDGVPVYGVEGDQHAIYPENFDAANVSDYGVASGAGSLTYDESIDRYDLETEGETGSFELYWYDSSGNDTVRYEAIVQVDDLATVEVLSPDEADDLRADADEWRSWNATVTEVRERSVLGHAIFGAPESNQETMQVMVNRYLTLESPTHLLSGGFTAAVIISVTTLGGLFFILVLKFPDALLLRKIYGELFERKRVEADEGDLATRQEAEDMKERLNRFANWDWQDVPPITDHMARAIREAADAETPLEGFNKWVYVFHPDRLKESRVRAMGQSGYVAQVETDTPDGVATDGGAVTITEATLAKADDVLAPDETVSEREDLRSLTEPSEELLAAIALDDPELQEFPLENPDEAPFDLEHFDEPPADLSLPALIDEFDFDAYDADDEEHVGRLFAEFVTAVYNHPITDDEGRVDPPRYELENLFQFMQAADDRYQVPLAKWYKQMFERALIEYDEDHELQQFLDDHAQHTDSHDA